MDLLSRGVSWPDLCAGRSADAEFVRPAIHLLTLDRGDEMHLLEGVPREWLGPGMVTRLQGGTVTFAAEPVQVANFAPVSEPEVQLSLLRLLSGAVEPTGWLRDLANAPLSQPLADRQVAEKGSRLFRGCGPV
jgi:hypothetical protein